ncbi:molybdopterin-dependent oxidoreductase [Thermodesulfobacteriota bacterium]
MKFNGKDITELLAVNRRNFIKLFVGGAIGTGLSPLPWKLTDDIAIWTQNWPWITVPPVGNFSHVKSVCTLCPGGCGIEVRKVDDRAVKIEGRNDYPVNPGGICPLGMGGLQLLYNEGNRFTGPMKRIGSRGSGKFQGITWDEALGILAGRISDIRKRSDTSAIVAVDGNPVRSTMSVMVERLLNAIGSPNHMRIPSSEDTCSMANKLMQGNDEPITYDLENSDYILSFGAGLLEGWGSPGRVINTWGLWKSHPLKKGKVRIVQVESRASNTASKADQWVPARPGTEAALALGIAHVIIKEGLYNRDFLENHTFGFSDWNSSDGSIRKGFSRMVMEKYSPRRVEDITGIKGEEIVSIARNFARAKAPVALCGKGKGELNGSLYEFMAVHALNALTGNINRTGGTFIHDPLPLSPLPDLEMDSTARDGLKKERIDRAGGKIHPFSHSLFNNFTDAISREAKSPVDTLLVFSANPAFTLPDGEDFKSSLEKIPFIVSFSPYHDETAYMADLVLPDHTYLEKMDDIVCPTGLPYPLYGLTQPVVEPIYDTRNSGDVIIQLAKLIGGSIGSSFAFNNYEEVLKSRVRGLFDAEVGLTSYDGSMPVWEQTRRVGILRSDYNSFDEMWKKIKSGGLWYVPLHGKKNRETLFHTPTGKLEFCSNQIELATSGTPPEDMGISAAGDEVSMPHYEPVDSDSDGDTFPLRMVPYELINLSSGWLPNPPYLNKTLFDDQLLKGESFVEINPQIAAKYHLKKGDRVLIESRKGKVSARVNIFEGAMPGILYMPLGMGHWAYDDFLYGKGVNPNAIINGGRDPLSGHPVWWNTPVRLTKV